VEWIYVVQDRKKFLALVNAVMNLRFRFNCGEFLE
jgi:hypothetical protein